MALRTHTNNTLKWISPGILLNQFDEEVLLDFDTCDVCGKNFIGTLHNNPDECPIELAFSYCGCVKGEK